MLQRQRCRGQLFFDPKNRLLDAGKPCFEAIDAGVAHEPSTDQQLRKRRRHTKRIPRSSRANSSRK